MKASEGLYDERSISYFSFVTAAKLATISAGSEDDSLSKVKPAHQQPLELGIQMRANADGNAVISYIPGTDFRPPASHPERLEWIRKSYERFLQKVLEKEQMVGAPPTDIS